jgi:aspartate ammonia-lyase
MKADYVGEETAKALQNFGRGQAPREVIKAYAEVKLAALRAIQETERYFSEEVFCAVTQALGEIIAGEWDGLFSVPLAQGGAGTSLHMNLLEVATERARELLAAERGSESPAADRGLSAVDGGLDPIRDLNRYQSTNDTFPTAVAIVAYRRLQAMEGAVIALQEALIGKEGQYARALTVGRTELQDALPMTVGQIYGAWAGAVERDRWRLNKLKERSRTVALGGTALGTCFSAPREYIYAAEGALCDITGLPLARSQNLPDEISNQDKLAEIANGVGLVALNLRKFSQDMLFYSSSPVSEMRLPKLQAASTIMAAKVNPVLAEHVLGLAIQAEGQCQTAREFSAHGMLNLNAMLPFIVKCLIEAFDSAEAAVASAIRLAQSAEPDLGRMGARLRSSQALLNALLPAIGYRAVESIAERLRGKEPADWEEIAGLVQEASGLSAEEARGLLSQESLTSSGAKGRKHD